MARYIQYYKLQKYVENQPVQEFKKGEVVTTDWWPSITSCEQNEQPTWEVLNNEYICEQSNASNLYNQYQKLQKYVGGEPYQPEEFMKGDLVQDNVDYFENIEDCENNIIYTYIETDQYICEVNAENRLYYTLVENIPSNVESFDFQFKYIDDNTWSTFTIQATNTSSVNFIYAPYRILFGRGSGTTPDKNIFGKYLISIDLTNIKIDNLNNVRTMFDDCVNLEKVNFGNIDASQITETYHCFDGCEKLNEIILPRALYNKMITNNDTNADWSKIKVIFND